MLLQTCTSFCFLIDYMTKSWHLTGSSYCQMAEILLLLWQYLAPLLQHPGSLSILNRLLPFFIRRFPRLSLILLSIKPKKKVFFLLSVSHPHKQTPTNVHSAVARFSLPPLARAALLFSPQPRNPVIQQPPRDWLTIGAALAKLKAAIKVRSGDVIQFNSVLRPHLKARPVREHFRCVCVSCASCVCVVACVSQAWR